MSSRTKGFFEQEQRSKPRPGNWHRNQSRTTLGDTTNVTAPPKPPVPATSQVKSKLKAFQFVAGQPEVSRTNQEGKENEKKAGPVERTVDPHNATSSSAPLHPGKPGSASDMPDSAAKTPQLTHANTFPSTPGARLSLEDLIGNVDETREPEPREESPEEHIGWIPNSSSTQLTPNRKRKRARSSSPSCPNTSSQRAEASAFFAGSAEKRTPEADPAADLWQRYGISKDSGNAMKLPELNSILFPGSPRPFETPVKGSGLRRWASTGNDWPSSKRKKQRSNASAKVDVWQNGQAESGGRSKVAAMVEKIQESLATQRLALPAISGDEPASSDPLPDTGSKISEVQQITTRPEPESTTIDAKPFQRMGPPSARPQGGARNQTSASTSGKDELQREIIGSHGQDTGTVMPAPLHLQSKAPLPAFRRPSIRRSSIQEPPKTVPAPSTVAANLPVVAEDFDEFGDDMEFSTEDLDELLSQPLQNRRLHEIPEHPNPPPQQQQQQQQQQSLPVQQTVASELIDLADDDFDDDEFACDDLDETSFMEAELQATQSFRPSSQRTSKQAHSSRSPNSKIDSSAVHRRLSGQHYRRFVVQQTMEGEYANNGGRYCPEKVLVAKEERTGSHVSITLRDSWADTTLTKGHVIHVSHLPGRLEKSEFFQSQQLELNDGESSAFLVVHPDHMLSATTVADSFDCTRKAVLQDRIKATGESSKAMIYGKILHEIFQQALSGNKWDNVFLAELVDKTVQAHVEGLWELGMQDAVLATEEIKAKMGELAAWAKVFVSSEPSNSSLVDDRNGEKVWMSVSKVIAIEEHVWSPQYGLKGNIDATIQASLRDDPRKPLKQLVTPFEVKTGRTTQSPAHRAQTALYTLLLSDRYDVTVKAGILYYLESSNMTRIAPPVNEIRQMVQERNRLASYIFKAKYPTKSETREVEEPAHSQESELSGLPPLLRSAFKCGRCYAQQSCFTYHALVEDGTAESAGMVDDGKKNHALVWQEAVGHLLDSSDKNKAKALRSWFSKWDRLLTFEESESSRFRKELWTMASSEREESGRCFGMLVIAQDLTSTATAVSSIVVDGIEGSGGKINRFTYVLGHAQSGSAQSGASFAEGSQLTIGEPIVVSSEQGQWALANGYVIATSKRNITVAVDRKLGDARQKLSNFDADHNQAFKGVMNTDNRSRKAEVADASPQLYRVDKDEFSNGLALIRNKLVTLMSSHPIHTKLRNQIVFDAPPKFASSTLPTLQPSQLGQMNDDQQAAVSKVLAAQDYALILGMPGTGKTTTIAHVIRALLAENKTILLTSFTHTAVDNILLKIRDVAPEGSILRLGVPAKINPEVQTFCQLAATPRHSIGEIDETYMGCQIVATTCMGTNHALFQRRAFDVCIVDEASQITLPTSLGPLLHARKFVLVGDHFQLPPLVQNRDALEGGLDISLFKQLSERFPEAVATLGRQYRMCEDIMSLSNELIYSGQLKCGTESVANRTLKLANESGLEVFHRQQQQGCGSYGPSCWLNRLTNPQNKVVFANIDPIGPDALETLTSGKNITNATEAALTAQTVSSLLALGVPGREIGVITLYRSQLALLRNLFRAAGISPEVEIDSADRFQGRDKECIILSMVRSNEAGIVGDLLKDWRRVNVAFTRARSKLVVLGSRRTLSNNELLAKFMALVDGNGWSVDLPKGADELHAFAFASTQSAAVVAVAEAASAKKPSPKGKRESTLSQQLLQSSTNNVKRKRSSSSTSSAATKVLQESESAGNRHMAKSGDGKAKKPGRTITGSGASSGRPAMKAKQAKLRQQVAMDIFEDMDFDFEG